MHECRRVAPETGLEGGNKEEKSLKEGDQGGQGPKTGRNAIEEEEEGGGGGGEEGEKEEEEEEEEGEGGGGGEEEKEEERKSSIHCFQLSMLSSDYCKYK